MTLSSISILAEEKYHVLTRFALMALAHKNHAINASNSQHIPTVKPERVKEVCLTH